MTTQTLHHERSGGAGGPAVVLVHGITSNLRAWDVVLDALDDGADPLDRIAVDLRGRGRSANLPGPSSMNRHADDLVALLDDLHVAEAMICGHSMGAFVACAAAVRHPGRFPTVVLVDGGPPLADNDPVPDHMIEEILGQIIGPSLERLGMRFDSPQTYRDFWRAHPALAEADPAWVDAYADYDLVPDGQGQHRSRVSRARVIEDGRDLLTNTGQASAFIALRPPSLMLRAERGMLGGPEGLYTDERIGEIRAAAADLTIRDVAGVNHYTILTASEGVRAVVAGIGDAVAALG